MKISVVIPVYNAERTLKQCLECLKKQVYTDYEVILVDNNSKDASVDIIRKFLEQNPQVEGRLLSETRQGSCAARNTGARSSSGEVIANIDPDCLPSESWLKEMSEAFKNPEVAAVAGNIRSAEPNNIYEKFSSLFTLRGLEGEILFTNYSLSAGGFATANLAIRADWFRRIGGFDEDINYHKGVGLGEDHDLCSRLYQAGGKLLATPRAIVFHQHRGSARGIWGQGFHFGLAHALLLHKYFEKYLLIQFGKRTIQFSKLPLKAWIDLSSADKKTALLVALSILFWPFTLLIPIYLAYLSFDISSRAKREKLKVSKRECIAMAGILILKSASMTLGRIWGSFKFRVFCF